MPPRPAKVNRHMARFSRILTQRGGAADDSAISVSHGGFGG